jgi:hypothetical protein
MVVMQIRLMGGAKFNGNRNLTPETAAPTD